MHEGAAVRSSGCMKPNPRSVLKNFTVPIAISVPPFSLLAKAVEPRDRLGMMRPLTEGVLARIEPARIWVDEATIGVELRRGPRAHDANNAARQCREGNNDRQPRHEPQHFQTHLIVTPRWPSRPTMLPRLLAACESVQIAEVEALARSQPPRRGSRCYRSRGPRMATSSPRRRSKCGALLRPGRRHRAWRVTAGRCRLLQDRRSAARRVARCRDPRPLWRRAGRSGALYVGLREIAVGDSEHRSPEGTRQVCRMLTRQSLEKAEMGDTFHTTPRLPCRK